MSTTVVNPRLDSISRRNRFNGTAPPRPAERQWGSVKCTWEFQNPAVTVDRSPGRMGIPAGIARPAPTAETTPSRTTTSAGIGVESGVR